MTKDEILQSSDIKIAHTVINQTFEDVNEKYLNDPDLTEDQITKTEGYLDGLKFCMNILKQVNGIRDSLKNED